MEAAKQLPCVEQSDGWRERPGGGGRLGTCTAPHYHLLFHLQDEEVRLLQSGPGHLAGVGDVGHVHPALLQRVQQVRRQEGEGTAGESR